MSTPRQTIEAPQARNPHGSDFAEFVPYANFVDRSLLLDCPPSQGRKGLFWGWFSVNAQGGARWELAAQCVVQKSPLFWIWCNNHACRGSVAG
jgi:hypothetical protein